MDRIAIGNHIATERIIKQMNARRDEVRTILRNCAIDGCTSIENIRYELARQLNMGSVYNMSAEDLEKYVKGVRFVL